MRKRLLISALSIVVAASISSCANSGMSPASSEAPKSTEVDTNDSDVSLKIPSVESIKQNGYPVNEGGLTYGPDLKDELMGPDLVLVLNEDEVLGYVKKSDLDGEDVSLTDAVNHDYEVEASIPMYLEDGETVIGCFTVGWRQRESL